MTTKGKSRTDQSHFAWLAANPLLAPLPEELDFVACGKYMRQVPSLDWGGPLPPALRQRTANEVKRAFAPTKISLQTAMALQNMLYTSLQHRDPRLPANRRWPYETGSLLGGEHKLLPWFPTYAAGANIRGITGCGKSFCVERFLSRFQQVYVHTKRPDCGWSELRQLVYLIAPMPADGSRSGLLLEIATQMDAILGTDYSTQLRTRYKTVEKGLVAVLHWLSLHKCGMLVIEEAQERHATTSIFGSDFVTFFLRVLNFGVPLVLVGNPLAFKNIDAFSQDVRRFSEGGRFAFDPVSDFRALAWTADLVPAIWGFNVFDRKDEPIDNLAKLLWDYTGGIPDALARLRRVALTEAIADGSDRVCAEHVKSAYLSPVFAPIRPLTQAFAKKQPSVLRDFKDIPVNYFEAKWGEEAGAAAQGSNHPAPANSGATKESGSGLAEVPVLEKSPTPQDAGPEREKRLRAKDLDDPADRRGIRFKQELLARQAATAAGKT